MGSEFLFLVYPFSKGIVVKFRVQKQIYPFDKMNENQLRVYILLEKSHMPRKGRNFQRLPRSKNSKNSVDSSRADVLYNVGCFIMSKPFHTDMCLITYMCVRRRLKSACSCAKPNQSHQSSLNKKLRFHQNNDFQSTSALIRTVRPVFLFGSNCIRHISSYYDKTSKASYDA